MRRAAAALAGLAVAGSLAGCAMVAGANSVRPPVSTQPSPQGEYRGLGLDPPQPRPTFTLRDTAGRPFDFAARTRGHPTFLFFGYTHCPDVCPTTMADVAAALRGVPDRLRRAVQVVFVTTDIKHDTGPVIAAWLRHFDTALPNRFIGLTGSQGQIDAAQAAAHVTLAEDGGQTHATDVLLYGADDYAHVKYLQSDNEADQIAHDLPLIAKTA